MLSNSISHHHYSHLKNRSTDSCTNKKFGKGQKQSAGPSTESNNNGCSNSKTANGILQQFAQQAAVLALKNKSRESHNTSAARASASNEQEVRIRAFIRWKRPLLEPNSCLKRLRTWVYYVKMLQPCNNPGCDFRYPLKIMKSLR